MATTLDRRLDRILGGCLSPILRPMGFRRNGAIHLAQREEVAWVVDVQTSRWNDQHEARFTLNGGVYIPGIVSRYSMRPEPKLPKLVDCCLSVRVGMLDPSRLDRWWKLEATANRDVADERIGNEVSEIVRDRLLPFLGEFETLESIADFLSAPVDKTNRFVAPQSEAQRLAYAALIHAQLGDAASSHEAIVASIRKAVGSPIEHTIRKLDQSLRSTVTDDFQGHARLK